MTQNSPDDVRKDHEDEIDLYEILLILKRRLFIILSSVIVALSISLAYVFTAPEVYRSTSALSLKVDPIEVSKVITMSLMDVANEKLPVIFSLDAVASEYVKSLDNIALGILNSYSFKKTLADLIEKEYPDVRIGEKEIERIFIAEVDRKTGNIVLKADHKNKEFSRKILERAIEKLEYSVKALSKELYKNEDVIKTVIIEKPTTHDRPVKPRKPLIVIASLISSLLFGIFLALFVEWFSKAKKRSMAQRQ